MSDTTDAPASPPSALGAPLSQRLRRRLAALSAVGALMVALPLVQVLRFQSAEVRALMSEQAGLDPVARAVQVQRGLLAHRDLAGLVLRGRIALEPERRQQQSVVDSRAEALAVALTAGQWERAGQESDALREDWTLLARQVGERSVDADESDRAHGLLIEQTLQVIDLVADASAPRADLGPGRNEALLAVVHAMPRLAVQMAALAEAGAHDAGTAPADPGATQAALARLFVRLNAAQERQVGSGSPLAGAAAAAHASADHYFQALRGTPGRTAEMQAASAAALRAQWQLFDVAADAAAAALTARVEAVEQRRALLLTAMATLALSAMALMAALWRGVRDAAAGPPTPGGARMRHDRRVRVDGEHVDGKRAEAGRLLQRLRGGDAPVSRGAPADTRAQPEPTSPPQD